MERSGNFVWKFKVKIIFKLCAYVAILLTGNNSWATDWEKIAERSHDTIYVDLDSYSIKDGYPSIIIKTTPNLETRDENTYHDRAATKTDRFQFDCKNHQVRKMIGRNRLTTNSKNTSSPFRPLSPNTLEKEIESLVCQVNKMLGGL